MEQKTILVTGGAGFIGSNIVDDLINRGHSVVVVDNLLTGSKDNLNPKAKFYEVDIRDYDLLERVFNENPIDYVIHTAAQISVSLSVRKPIFDEDINIKGILNLLELSVAHKIKKFVFSSSGGVMYGDTNLFPTPETVCPNPISPYGIAKLASEKYLQFYNLEKGLNYTILRYGNVFGPRQNPDGEAGVIAIFIKKMLNHNSVTINGDGKYIRDYVYVKDVVKANILALDYGDNDFFNIGTSIGKDVNDVFKVIKDNIDYNLEPNHGPARPGDLRKSILDASKAKKILGWTPEYSFNEAIKETIAFFKEKYGK